MLFNFSYGIIFNILYYIFQMYYLTKFTVSRNIASQIVHFPNTDVKFKYLDGILSKRTSQPSKKTANCVLEEAI